MSEFLSLSLQESSARVCGVYIFLRSLERGNEPSREGSGIREPKEHKRDKGTVEMIDKQTSWRKVWPACSVQPVFSRFGIARCRGRRMTRKLLAVPPALTWALTPSPPFLLWARSFFPLCDLSWEMSTTWRPKVMEVISLLHNSSNVILYLTELPTKESTTWD